MGLPLMSAATKSSARPLPVRRSRVGPGRLERRRNLWAYLFISPVMLFLLLFAILPIFFSLWVSLHNWNLIAPIREMPWAGGENFRYLVADDDIFRRALRNTFVFAFWGVALNLTLGLLGALLLNSRVRWRPLWATFFFLPIVTAPLALSMMWTALLNKNFGLVNELLSWVGIPPQPFLSSPSQALASIILMAVYQYVGYYIVIFLAGLQGVPQDYYDAASVDGANRWQSFRFITLPLLRPVILFLVVTNTIGALQVFDLVFGATTGGAETSGGGPANSTMVVVLHMYNTAFKFFRMGRASAMAMILFAVIFLITLLQLRLLRNQE